METEIRFTRDYRGKLTQERFFVAGSTVSLSRGTAAQIVAEDAAEYVEQPETVTDDTGMDEAKPKRKRIKRAE